MKIWFIILISVVLSAQCISQTVAGWQKISQPQNFFVTCFLETPDNTLFIGGHQRSLFRSTDDGSSWVNANGMIQGDTIQSLASAGKYIFAGTNLGMFRSSNKGESWEPANSGFDNGSLVIHQISKVDSTLYIAADKGVYQSTDLGSSWKAINEGLAVSKIPATHTVPAFGVTANHSGIFASQIYSGAYILYPQNTVWNYGGLGTRSINEGALISIDTSVFAGSQGGVYMYSGHDTTWLKRNTGLPDFISFCFFAAVQHQLFLYVNGVGIFTTSDLWSTWTRIDENTFSGSSVTSMLATNKFLIVSTGSAAWRLPITNLLSTVHTDNPGSPAHFSLYQNYPNPFNPSTTISFDLPNRSFVSLKIFDLLGREVATIVSKELPAGNHAKEWNAAELGSGVYFYRLQTDAYSAVKKLILTK